MFFMPDKLCCNNFATWDNTIAVHTAPLLSVRFNPEFCVCRGQHSCNALQGLLKSLNGKWMQKF